jgi:hypothetical protein
MCIDSGSVLGAVMDGRKLLLCMGKRTVQVELLAKLFFWFHSTKRRISIFTKSRHFCCTSLHGDGIAFKEAGS